jgi:predicted ATPase/class 3 adenylate cyclase
LALTCAACGFVNEADERFCGGCGRSLVTPSSTPPPTLAVAAPPPPQTYTPRHLAEKILASRAGLEGERKQVTVLFADVVGSTELIRDLDPEDAQRLLDGAVTRMMDAVHRYEGTVSRAMGDGIMALFGAPIAHEDHAVRACYAALAMHEAIRAHAEEMRREHGVRLQARVGLNSGEVVVRLISDDLHMDYTALGQTVHLASRMEQVATPGGTALAGSTLALVEGYVQVRSLGPIPVKGMDAPVETYELVGTGALRTRMQVSAARGLTRFVGRDTEMQALYAALEHARAGRGQVAALVGEPGVGKSRLVWELTHSHRTEGWTILESGSVSHGKATPWLPVVDLLKAYFRVEQRDDARAVREKVLGKLLALDEELRPLLPALLALLDQVVEDATWTALDPAQRRRQTLDGVKRLLLRESQEQPLLVVFEDLHWLDTETQVLLDSLVEGVPAARVLLLVNYRPEYRHEWGSKSSYSQVRVDPLGAESVVELMGTLLGDDPTVEPLAALLMERTAGNPFFIEESIRTLVETGVLEGERGAYHLTRSVEAIRVPATVQAMLAARIDRLTAEDKRLLQTASVLGKDIAHPLLFEIAEMSDGDLRAGLGRLQAAEFVYETAMYPEVEYTFKHALTHDVAYGSLLQERRKGLHGRVVDAIERLYAGQLDGHFEVLAHHAHRGERWASALHYCRQAGIRAVNRSTNRAAIAWLEQALEALDRLPTDSLRSEEAIEIRLELGAALRPIGDNDGSMRRLVEAEQIAARMGDRRRQARVFCQIGYGHNINGEYDHAIAVLQRAMTTALELCDVRLEAAAMHRLAQANGHLGNYARSIELLRSEILAIRGDLARERLDIAAYPVVEARLLLAGSLVHVGNFAEADSVSREAIRMAETLNHPFTSAIAIMNRGLVCVQSDNLIEGIAVFEQLHQLVATGEFDRYRSWAASYLGNAYARGGRVAEALPLLDEGARLDCALRNQTYRSYLAVTRGEGYLLAQRDSEAKREALHALDLARSRHEPGHEALALRLIGEVARRQEPPDLDGAELHFTRAQAIATELGMRPLQAHCHLGLGKLYRAIGRIDEARAGLSTAVEMYRSMDLTHWLPEAETELRKCDG